TNKSSSGQMPTPPWTMTISDNESDELDSDQRKLKKNTTPNADNNLRPCVDNWKIQTLCNAKPLNETNKSSSGQMPTPPWTMTISDNESDELDSDQRKLKKNTTPNADNNLRPCVDNWKIQTLCNAKPLNE
ncbi:unnamed protein product, partial [Schistosoma turkestanicum]